MPFERQPTLQDAHVTLRPLVSDDFDALYAVASDPLIWEQHPASDRYQRPVFEQFFADALLSQGAFVVLDTQTGQIIGSSRYFGYDESASVVEIGWSFLARAYWGGHFNRSMKSLMLDHAFQFVERVEFLVGPNNQRSRRAMEKIGGVLTGTRTNAPGVESVEADWVERKELACDSTSIFADGPSIREISAIRRKRTRLANCQLTAVTAGS